jgi:hypothetical protein
VLFFPTWKGGAYVLHILFNIFMKTKIETLFFMPNWTQIKEMVYQNQCKLVNNTRQGLNMQSLLLDHTVQGEFKKY